MASRSFYIILFLLCRIAFLQAQTPSLDSLQSLLPRLEGKERLAVLYTLSNQMESVLPAKAYQYGSEGLVIARELNDSASAATLLSSLAFSSSELGNFPDALSYAFQSLEISTALKDKMRIASANSTLGITYVYLGQYSNALMYHLEALRLREELGLHDRAANSMNNIGVAYHNIGQYDKAIQYYRKAMERLGAELKDNTRARYYTNIGYSEFKLGNIDTAKYYYAEALRLSAHSPYSVVTAYLYFNLGTLHSEIGDLRLALDYLHRSLRSYSALQQKHGMLQLYIAVGETYTKSREYRTALVYLDSAAVLGNAIKAPEQLKKCYETFYQIYQVIGPLEKEYQYYRLFSMAKDSLMNYNQSKKIAEALFNHEIAEQQRQIELLKKERTIANLNVEQDDLQAKVYFGGMILSILAVVVLYIFNYRMKKDKLKIERKNSEMKQLNIELQEKIGEVNLLTGFLPICSNCKKIRDEKGEWEQMEKYISHRSEAQFSHGICPDCMKALYGDVLKRYKQ